MRPEPWALRPQREHYVFFVLPAAMLTYSLTIHSAQRNNRIFLLAGGSHPTIKRMPERKIAKDFRRPFLCSYRDLDLPIGTDQFVVGPKSQVLLVVEPRTSPAMLSGPADGLVTAQMANEQQAIRNTLRRLVGCGRMLPPPGFEIDKCRRTMELAQ